MPAEVIQPSDLRNVLIDFFSELRSAKTSFEINMLACNALAELDPERFGDHSCPHGCTCDECAEYERYLAAGHPEISTDEEYRVAVTSGLLAPGVFG